MSRLQRRMNVEDRDTQLNNVMARLRAAEERQMSKQLQICNFDPDFPPFGSMSKVDTNRGRGRHTSRDECDDDEEDDEEEDDGSNDTNDTRLLGQVDTSGVESPGSDRF